MQAIPIYVEMKDKEDYRELCLMTKEQVIERYWKKREKLLAKLRASYGYMIILGLLALAFEIAWITALKGMI
jgi:hypothetical protein